MRLKQLQNELSKAKERLKKLEEQKQVINNRVQLYEARAAKAKRAARTRHLIIIGAVAEKYFPQLHELSEEEINKFFEMLHSR